MVIKWGVPLGLIHLLQDPKSGFEQIEEKLAGVIGLFSASKRVALNLTILVTPKGIEPFLAE